MKKPVLIAYFSRAGNNYANGRIVDLAVGNTEVAALHINEVTGGVLFKIDPIRAYSRDYDTCTEEAKQELRSNVRPPLTHSLESIAEFDSVILGYPNWWGTMPLPVKTFLESHDFTGKTILPLCTHEGSGMGISAGDIQKLCPDATVRTGLAIQGTAVKTSGKAIDAWLKENGLWSTNAGL